MPAAVKPCTCKHDYQDRKYGPGMRVKNQIKTAAQLPPKFRCTVCAKVD